MSRHIVAPDALEDMDQLWNYWAIERVNLGFAERLIEDLTSAFGQLAQTPGLGHRRSDLAAQPLLFWKVRKYFVIYRTVALGVEIVRVLHSAQDIRSILGEEA